MRQRLQAQRGNRTRELFRPRQDRRRTPLGWPRFIPPVSWGDPARLSARRSPGGNLVAL
jgi:hypothetical protein